MIVPDNTTPDQATTVISGEMVNVPVGTTVSPIPTPIFTLTQGTDATQRSYVISEEITAKGNVAADYGSEFRMVAVRIGGGDATNDVIINASSASTPLSVIGEDIGTPGVNSITFLINVNNTIQELPLISGTSTSATVVYNLRITRSPLP